MTRFMRRPGRIGPVRQQGATSVEVALLSIVFFTFVFGILEVSRLLYVENTLPEVTRRAASAAANIYPSDTAALDRVRQGAIFRTTPGGLLLAPPITDTYVRIDYLRYDLSMMPQSAWPADAVSNRLNCASNPQALDCIRFVQARICKPGGADSCTAVTSKMMIPLLDWTVVLTKATTIVPAETLGYVQGTPPSCPCP